MELKEGGASGGEGKERKERGCSLGRMVRRKLKTEMNIPCFDFSSWTLFSLLLRVLRGEGVEPGRPPTLVDFCHFTSFSLVYPPPVPT